MGFPYSYKPGPDRLGIGVDNFAFQRPNTILPSNTYGPRYNIRMSFAPAMGGAQFPLSPSGPRTDLRGNGVYLSGDLALQRLVEFERARAK